MTTAIRKHIGDFVALLALFLVAIGISAYIIANQDARPRIPFLEAKGFKLKAEFSDAQAVTPGQGQSVRVAGVQVGKITEVTLHNGIAVVTMDLDPKWKKKLDVKSDATALLRPRTGLKDMFVELDPGGNGTTLHDGDTIPVQNTAPDVDPDEILSAFDTDTRSYLQLLINGAGKGLKGHGNDLNQTFKALGPTYHDLARVSSAIAERRHQLQRLVHNYGQLTNTLANSDGDIHRLINSSDAVFRAFASEDTNISLAVSKLPSTLRQTQDTLNKVGPYARIAGPTFQALRAPFRQLDVANHAVLPFVKEAEPIVRTKIRPFVQVARPNIRNLRPAAKDLAAAAPDLVATFHELNRFFNMAGHNPNGAEPVANTGNPAADAQTNSKRDEGYLFWLGWATQNTVSLFSTSDASGPLRRFTGFFTCSELRTQLAAQPAGGALLGLSNALNNSALCPAAEGGTPPSELLPGVPNPGLPLPKGKSGDKSTSKGPTPPPTTATTPAPTTPTPAPAPAPGQPPAAAADTLAPKGGTP